MRDGGLLLDVSALRDIELDVEAMTATVGPGCHGDDLLAACRARSVLPGRTLPRRRPRRLSAAGRLRLERPSTRPRLHERRGNRRGARRAASWSTPSEHQNADLLWAARGAGPGFFGVVTRFHLRLVRRPKVVVNSVFLYPIDVLEQVFSWAHEIGPRVARVMELMLFIHRTEEGELEIAVTGPVLADSEQEAREAVAVLESCPVLERAKLALPYVPGELADLYAGAHAAYPDGSRYSADNMWTHAPVEELLPGLRRIAETLPPAPSHMLWMNWQPGTTPQPERPDMAYSVEDDTYIALYGVWQDPTEDEQNVAWATERMREMQPLASGIQLADENLGNRPARFVGEAQLARLDELRTKYDPDRRFHSWMGRPQHRA